MKSAAFALKETKGWLVVGGIVLGAAVGLYFFARKALGTIAADAAALPGKALSGVGSALAGTVAGAADAVGQFGLATNDALGGIPGAAGDAGVSLFQSLFGTETYSGFEYGATEHRWTKVVGQNSGDIFPVDAKGNVLDASGNTVGHFNG